MGVPVADGHDRRGLRRGQHMLVSGASMVGMAMGDDGTLDGFGWINVEAPGSQ